MRLRTSTAIVLLLSSLPATAANWREISMTSERVVYADTTNVLRRGDIVRVWSREAFARDQVGEGLPETYKSVKVLMQYDCARRTSAVVMRVYYAAGGTEIRRFRVEGLTPPTPVEPDTPTEKIFVGACPPAPAVAANPKPTPEKASLSIVGAAAAAELSPAAKPETGSGHSDAKPAEAHAAAPVAESKPAEIAPDRVQKAKRTVSSKRARKQSARPVRVAHVASAPMTAPAMVSHDVHWTYSGESGAENWGRLKTEWSMCATGDMQSPIDVRDGARLDLEPIKFEYRLSGLRIIDNGHTVQVNYPGGNAITVGGVRYDLLQMHFHKPSEERINGRTYDMVAHLVHKSGDGRLAVIAVLFEIGDENAFLKALWPHLPLEEGREVTMPGVRIPLETLLPQDRGYYTYMGSLTTPPCTEGVLWLVMKTPVSISPDQVNVFGRLYPMNARPVQAANGRFIKESM